MTLARESIYHGHGFPEQLLFLCQEAVIRLTSPCQWQILYWLKMNMTRLMEYPITAFIVNQLRSTLDSVKVSGYTFMFGFDLKSKEYVLYLRLP